MGRPLEPSDMHELEPLNQLLARELLGALRGRFAFRDHPDFRADWEALLRRARDSMADVETHIAKLAQLPRSDDRISIRRRLASAGICILVGESGSGKSALAKEIALADYPRWIWLSANMDDIDLSDEPNLNTGAPWSVWDDADIRWQLDHKVSVEEIAYFLCRTPAEIRRRIQEIAEADAIGNPSLLRDGVD